MIPRTFPSILGTLGETKMVVYVLPSVSGLQAWKDYIPVKGITTENTAVQNTYANDGYQVMSPLEDISTKQAWKDYIPVFEDASYTKAWSTDAGGYIPASGLFSVYSLFANNEQGVWYDPSDLTTLFQDAAGTTPVTAVEQPVGLMLDKRDTAYSTYFDGSGDYLNTSSSAAFDFSSSDFTVEGWFFDTAVNSVPHYFQFGSSHANRWNVLRYTGNTIQLYITTSGFFQTGVAAPLNSWFHLAVSKSGTTTRIFLNGTQIYSTTAISFPSGNQVTSIGWQNYSGGAADYLSGYVSNFRVVKGTALYTSNFTPSTTPLTAVSGTSLLTCGTSWSGNPAITNNGNTRADKLNPFTTGTGNHAYQTTSANRPTLSARYNLLTKTEQFDDAAWTKYNVTTPNSTTIKDDTSTNYHYIEYKNLSFTSGTAYKLQVRLEKGTVGFAGIHFYDNAARGCSVNLTTGQLGSAYGGATATAIADGTGWILTITATAATTTAIGTIAIYMSTSNALASYTGTGNGTIYVSKADLRVANDGVGIPAYQRVNTATDYDTVGFPKYLSFNGSSSAMVTNTITPGTDKAQVFAGVRYFTTAPDQVVWELSVDRNTNNGTFISAVGYIGKLVWASKGTVAVDITSPSAITAPITNVVSDIGNISAPSATLSVNGTQVAQSTANQGTGNYGNYPLYIGARAGTSLWFNGRIYSMIVRFGSNLTTAQITNTEKYVNTKTKAY